MDSGAAARIAALAVEGTTAPHLLEIGAGTGALTAALLRERAEVTALEIDMDLARILRSRSDLSAATIVQADALTFDYAAYAHAQPWRVAGNLPYNIATPLVMRLVEMRGGPDVLTVMVQKDVAYRFVARPSTPAYGSLSIAVQYAMQGERAFTLRSDAFYPRPKVDSTVVRLTRRTSPAVTVRDETRFLQVVRAAFAYRRKTFANSLALALAVPRDVTTNVLRGLHIDTEIRGEQLDLADFARIADAL